MALDVDQLRTGLEEYRQTLYRQREQLRGDFDSLQRSFAALWGEYGGVMAEEFQDRWGRTAEWFGEYVETTRQLDQFLAERLEQLRHL